MRSHQKISYPIPPVGGPTAFSGYILQYTFHPVHTYKLLFPFYSDDFAMATNSDFCQKNKPFLCTTSERHSPNYFYGNMNFKTFSNIFRFVCADVYCVCVCARLDGERGTGPAEVERNDKIYIIFFCITYSLKFVENNIDSENFHLDGSVDLSGTGFILRYAADI